MLVNSVPKFRIEKERYREEYLSPKSQALLSSQKSISKFNNSDIKRPLKTNHQDLSFKGLSLLYKPVNTYSKKAFLDFADKHIGKMGRELFTDITEKHAADTRKLITVDGDNISINKKTMLHLAWDGLIYPIKVLPGDMLNGFFELLAKVPGLKKFASNILEKPMFKNIRQRSKIDSKVNSLIGMIRFKDIKLQDALKKFAKEHDIPVDKISAKDRAEIVQKIESKMDSDILKTELKQFDPKSGNYDTKHERSLNRLVSGMPPAIFLANDAYNLSRMMDDDSKAADKERKTRFKQETSRILTSGYLTLITMGAFQNLINKSKAGIVLVTGLTVLVTEMFSRLSNGKHIKKLTPEEARKENEMTHAPEAKIKPVKDQVSSTGAISKPDKQKEQQKPLLSFDTLIKGSAIVLGTGYGIKAVKHLPAVQKAALRYFEDMKLNNPQKYAELEVEKAFDKLKDGFKGIKPKKVETMSESDLDTKFAVKVFEDKVLYRPFTQLYKNLTEKPFLVEPEKFNQVVKTLRESGFERLADRYAAAVEPIEKDGRMVIDLGKRDKDFKVPFSNQSVSVKPFVNFVIAPFKFIWNTITLPYWMIDEKLLGVFAKKASKSTKDVEAIANSFDRITRQAEKLAKGKLTPKQFEDFVQVNLLKGFNQDSLSSVSNAELSNLAKTAASIATIWFLMTDNYNMVMLKSNGNDKEGANAKFKERFVQEGSRLFYQTLLIDLFNSTFRNQYNSSLMGMSVVTLVDTTLGEMLTRSSVGTPIKAHTRDELIDIETRQNNSTGFKKKYYKFMQRLTGKRSIKSYEVAPKNATKSSPALSSPIKPDKNVFFKQNV
ncbi:MAG: hypothetical protein NC191_00785 [Muribaculaceae bacterium]|nr:hypothetical protein [Muribaculaceae bacterium]